MLSALPSKSRAIGAAVLATLALMAAGCGGSSAPHSASAAHDTAAAWHQVVVCARAHGMPGLAEPTIGADGQAHFPARMKIPDETRQACQSLYDRLFPNGNHGTPTQAQLDGLLRFASCMRSHGIADWPDPSADGTFPLDTRLSHLLKSAIRGPLTTCEHLNPDANGRVYSGHG